MAVSARPTSVRRSRFGLDIALEMRRKGTLAFFEDLWRAEGDLVRLEIGPATMFLAVHPGHIEQITAGLGSTYDKGKSYDAVRELLLGDGVLTSTGALWKRQRRLMAPFFTPRAVDAYLPVIAEEALAFCPRWERAAQRAEPVDMLTEMMVITARIALRTMFSTASDDDVTQVKDDVETMISFVSGAQMTPIRAPLWLPTSRNRRYLAARASIHRYLGGVIAQRRAMPEAEWPADLLTALMRARDEETGQPMSDELLRDEAITLYFAGYETTARTLTFMWYALARNPAAAATMAAEIAAAAPGAPTLEQVRALAYATRVLKETMRMYPPAPMFVRDTMRDTELGGAPIPSGARIMIMPYLTHRHPDFWPAPERFDPERWTAANSAGRHEYAYLPFATGQRICIGNHLALMEALVLAAVLVPRFAPRLQPGYAPQWRSNGTLTIKNGLPMTIMAR